MSKVRDQAEEGSTRVSHVKTRVCISGERHIVLFTVSMGKPILQRRMMC
jgi:hypothetical protein